jgi:serine/threonine protein kinase
MKMLHPDPRQRPTAQQALKHEWFKQDESAIQDLLTINRQISKNVVEPAKLLRAIYKNRQEVNDTLSRNRGISPRNFDFDTLNNGHS